MSERVRLREVQRGELRELRQKVRKKVTCLEKRPRVTSQRASGTISSSHPFDEEVRSGQHDQRTTLSLFSLEIKMCAGLRSPVRGLFTNGVAGRRRYRERRDELKLDSYQSFDDSGRHRRVPADSRRLAGWGVPCGHELSGSDARAGPWTSHARPQPLAG